MNYSVDTRLQLRAVVKALRKIRGLNQADLGRLLGVNQKRISKIEADPGLASWDQIARMVAALGGRIVIQDVSAAGLAEGDDASSDTNTAKRPSRSKPEANW